MHLIIRSLSVILLAAVLLMAAFVAACGGDVTVIDTDATSEPTAAPAPPTQTVPPSTPDAPTSTPPATTAAGTTPPTTPTSAPPASAPIPYAVCTYSSSADFYTCAGSNGCCVGIPTNARSGRKLDRYAGSACGHPCGIHTCDGAGYSRRARDNSRAYGRGDA